MEWLVQNKSTGDEDDVIEDVTPKTLSTLISNIDNLVVLFCKMFSNFWHNILFVVAAAVLVVIESNLCGILQMIMATMIQ